MSKAHVLVVDDEPEICRLIKDILEDEGFEATIADNADAARQARRSRRPDLVLLDIWMPDTDGITLLKEWSEGGGLDIPVVIMSGHGTVETAVEATRLGAYDFLEKPLSTAKLLLTVKRALETAMLRQENLGLKQDTHPVSEPIGHSATMERLREQVKRIAQHDTSVLVTGEAGTGKEVFARYLHGLSTRRTGPIVRVVMAGMTSTEHAVELFGGEDNRSVHYGSLERANGGTLFLEDVADMDITVQARLLSALQHQSFLRLGSVEPVRVNVRIVAATARDLAEEVRSGRFREDLYYHLNVVPLHIPPLREHMEDLPELLDFYIDLLVTRDNLPNRRISVAAQNRLRNYAWPGNIRELNNLIQRLLILSSGDEVDIREVDAALGDSPRAHAGSAVATYDLPFKEAREQFERAYLEHQLKQTGGSITKLANRTGLERTNLYRKLRALGIDAKRVAGGER
jgi:DNA-binding NtrC family response regulator